MPGDGLAPSGARPSAGTVMINFNPVCIQDLHFSIFVRIQDWRMLIETGENDVNIETGGNYVKCWGYQHISISFTSNMATTGDLAPSKCWDISNIFADITETQRFLKAYRWMWTFLWRGQIWILSNYICFIWLRYWRFNKFIICISKGLVPVQWQAITKIKNDQNDNGISNWLSLLV